MSIDLGLTSVVIFPAVCHHSLVVAQRCSETMLADPVYEALPFLALHERAYFGFEIGQQGLLQHPALGKVVHEAGRIFDESSRYECIQL